MIQMNRVSLTKTEAEWFSRNVTKMTQLLEVSAQKDAGVLKRTTYKTLKSMLPMAAKAAADATPDKPTDIYLSRKQKLIIRDLVQSVNKTLVERVIPEYERRGESHKEYFDNAKAKAEALEKMARKFR